MNYIHKIDWYRDGYQVEGFTKENWSLTIINSINRLAAMIIHHTRIASGDQIRLNPDIKSLITNLEYYNEEKNTFLGRYGVIFDSEIEPNVIIVESKRALESKVIPTERTNEDGLVNEIYLKPTQEAYEKMGGVVPVGIEVATQEEIYKYKIGCGGYVYIHDNELVNQ
jgi:hypothetical protein